MVKFQRNYSLSETELAFQAKVDDLMEDVPVQGI